MVISYDKIIFFAEIIDKLLKFWRLDWYSIHAADAVEVVVVWNERFC